MSCSRSHRLQSEDSQAGAPVSQPSMIMRWESLSLHEHLLCAKPRAEALGMQRRMRSLRSGVYLAVGEPH